MWLVGVVIRKYIDILTIIINFPYSTCIRSFFGSSIPTSLFIFKMFFRSLYIYLRATTIHVLLVYIYLRATTIHVLLVYIYLRATTIHVPLVYIYLRATTIHENSKT